MITKEISTWTQVTSALRDAVEYASIGLGISKMETIEELAGCLSRRESSRLTPYLKQAFTGERQ